MTFGRKLIDQIGQLIEQTFFYNFILKKKQPNTCNIMKKIAEYIQYIE